MNRQSLLLNKYTLLGIFGLIIVIALGCLWHLWSYNRPAVFLRYYGSQPEMTVTFLPESTNSDSVKQVVQAAKEFFEPPQDYWPEPSNISERETFWWVKFSKKQEVVLMHGKEQITTQIPGVVCIQVEKSNLSCKIIPNR